MGVSAEHIRKCIEILRRRGATRVILFGSATDFPESARDVDVAVEGIEGWELFVAASEVEKVLDLPIDLVSLSPATDFTRCVQRKGRVLYERR